MPQVLSYTSSVAPRIISLISFNKAFKWVISISFCSKLQHRNHTYCGLRTWHPSHSADYFFTANRLIEFSAMRTSTLSYKKHVQFLSSSVNSSRMDSKNFVPILFSINYIIKAWDLTIILVFTERLTYCSGSPGKSLVPTNVLVHVSSILWLVWFQAIFSWIKMNPETFIKSVQSFLPIEFINMNIFNILSHCSSIHAAHESLPLTGYVSKQLDKLNCAFLIKVTVF
jgi:hypothetical protein